MRLIDADTLVQDLTESAAKAPNDFIKATIYTIIQVIRKAPTAFDVEKVAAQIESESYWTRSTFDEDGYSNDDAEEVVGLVRVLGTIKGALNHG